MFNPAGQVELDAEPTHERGIWTPSQLATFLACSESNRLGAAFRLVAFTGLRRGELCGIRWSDLNLEAKTATIKQQLVESGRELHFGEPKTKKGARVISLDAETVTSLRSHKAAQATERLAWVRRTTASTLCSAARTARRSDPTRSPSCLSH